MTKKELKEHVRAIQLAVERLLPEDEPDCVRPWVYETAVKVLAARLRPQEVPQGEYSSGCTEPEFPAWWAQFGAQLSFNERINDEMLALAGFSAGKARASTGRPQEVQQPQAEVFTRDDLNLIQSVCLNRSSEKFYRSAALADDREQLVVLGQKAGRLAKAAALIAGVPQPQENK